MASSNVSKCFFIVFNILILIFSAVCIYIAVLVAFKPDKQLESEYQITAEIAARARGYYFPDSADALKDLPLIHEIGIALLVLGIVVSVVSLLGCFGPCCSCLKELMMIFVIVMILLMSAEIVVFTMFLVPESPLHQLIRRNLIGKLQNYPNNQYYKDSFSLAIDMVNYYHHCCGIDGIGDFKQGPPISCTDTLSPLFYNKEGCYRKLTDILQENILWAGLGFGGLLLFQLILLILALVIYKKSNKVSPI